jgi:type IV fimbrial biogenesis protein FimT
LNRRIGSAVCAACASRARARRNMHMASHKGFTLIELMVTLFITAILLGAAIPSFVDMTVRNRLVTTTNDFISTINLARSESIRRASTVTICGTSDGAACAADAWSGGWIAFVDVNGDGDIDVGDTVLRVHGALAGGYTLSPDAVFATYLSYSADGSATATGAFAVCHEGEVEGARAIAVNPLRPRVAKDTDSPTDRIPNLDGGNIADCDEPSGS